MRLICVANPNKSNTSIWLSFVRNRVGTGRERSRRARHLRLDRSHVGLWRTERYRTVPRALMKVIERMTITDNVGTVIGEASRPTAPRQVRTGYSWNPVDRVAGIEATRAAVVGTDPKLLLVFPSFRWDLRNLRDVR